jgi:hypothetical protein
MTELIGIFWMRCLNLGVLGLFLGKELKLSCIRVPFVSGLMISIVATLWLAKGSNRVILFPPFCSI